MVRRSLVVLIALLAGAAGCTPARTPSRHLSPERIPFEYDLLLDVAYAERADGAVALDLYLPLKRSAATPVLVWFHGGGWTRSSKEQEALYILPYLARGWAVANVEYRLAAVAKAPAALSDGLCALRWLATHAAEHGLGLDRLVVSGISAGGGMALMVGMASPGSSHSADCGAATGLAPVPPVAAIVNWFGPSDLTDVIEGPDRHTQIAEWFDGAPNAVALATEISPLSLVRTGGPPVISIHGTADGEIPYAQSVALHRALDAAGVRNRLVTVDAGHGDFTPAQAEHAFHAVFDFLE